jgi:hypothetical protein
MTLTYPKELVPANVDYVTFRPFQYRTNQDVVGSDVNGGNRRSPSYSAPAVAEPIVLFMPTSSPAVDNQNGWNPVSFAGPLGALKRDLAIGAGSIIDSLGSTSPQGIGQKLLDQVKAAAGNAGEIGKQFGIEVIAELSGNSASNILAISRGKIYNPNVEMIYQGPQVRGFAFNYIFMPKSEEETQLVNKIILHFKKWSSPKPLNGMFEIPPVWQIDYMTGGVRNKNMNAFKRSVLTSVSIQDNSQLETHMSYKDGAPITTTMSLIFQEVDIITRDDHEDGRSNRGY